MPTISILVPVYNNAATVLATLDSILNLESIGGAELIISDDASTDGTTDLCRLWIGEFGKSFRRAELIENRVNLGVSGNHKVAFDAARGMYGLYLGGDDLFYDSRFLVAVQGYLRKHPETRIAKARIEAFYSKSGIVVDIYRYKRPFFGLTPLKQFACLAVLGNFLYAGPGTVLRIADAKAFEARTTRLGAQFDAINPIDDLHSSTRNPEIEQRARSNRRIFQHVMQPCRSNLVFCRVRPPTNQIGNDPPEVADIGRASLLQCQARSHKPVCSA